MARWFRPSASALAGLLLVAFATAPSVIEPTRAFADTVVLQPVRDNTLFEDPDGAVSDGAGPVLFLGNNSEWNTRRALLAFDVSSSLPSGAVIDSVRLRFVVSNAPNQVPRRVTVHRVLADWGEGSSYAETGTGAPATDGDATWLHAHFPASPWRSTGGDFDSFELTSVMVAGPGACHVAGDALTAEVRRWRREPGTNFGLMMRGDETQATTARRIESRESPTPASRPALFVHFHVAGVTDLTWGRLKDDYR